MYAKFRHVEFSLIAFSDPLPGVVKLRVIEELLFGAASERIHDLDHPALPLLFTDKSGFLDLVILFFTKFEISFRGI